MLLFFCISVCGKKQFAILIQFLNCLLQLLRCFCFRVAKAMWSPVVMPVARHSLVIMSPSTYNFASESVFLSLCRDIRGSSMPIYVWIKESERRNSTIKNVQCQAISIKKRWSMCSSWKYMLGQYLYDGPIKSNQPLDMISMMMQLQYLFWVQWFLFN